MVRIGLCAFACALALVPSLPAQSPTPEQRQKSLLAVQVALEQGQELLQKGEFAAAVTILEKQIPYIDGNRRYLTALRDAYRGHIQQLEQGGQQAEAKKYQGFLDILDPPARGAVAKATPTAITKTPVHRGKAEDDDPFAESNHARKPGQSLLEQAERAYEERNYEGAARLYMQADRAEPGCVSVSLERWGYCKLYCVAQRINRASGDVPTAQLEVEVRHAVRMSPRLERFGQSLLDRLRGNTKSEHAVDVKHTPRKDGGWAVAETGSFRIFHAVNQETAEKIARIAEATRISMSKKWFAEDARPWTPRCDIYIHPSGAGYAKATGAPAASPGHSSIQLERGRILTRRIDIRGDDPNFLVGVLPHETTHVVLAGRFGSHHVPRWADEGMAVLSEPRERIDLHLRNLPMHEREGTLFPVGELMKMDEYPEPRRIGPFYAQSVSLVEFLCKKKDPATFARFLHEALDGKYEVALERHFGYRSFAELDREWKQHAFGEGRIATAE